MRTASRFVILSKTDNETGKQQHRILDTFTFEFEPRIYGYKPENECKALNDQDVITVVAIESGPGSEESR